MELKEMCKIIRHKQGLSQKELAKQIRTTQTEISFIERGFIPPHDDRIKAIEKMYNEL